eukprot:TRINITY_DN1490_c0_g1_i3.p1 TRINITY_DN1490_c0_g1~~TRINITY_DN1490_c0_g1_i3.p1  ORF type:complete len:236 (-),score=24.65 TRINITY_DN1490_c0_g1_i3:222-929(-)
MLTRLSRKDTVPLLVDGLLHRKGANLAEDSRELIMGSSHSLLFVLEWILELPPNRVFQKLTENPVEGVKFLSQRVEKFSRKSTATWKKELQITGLGQQIRNSLYLGVSLAMFRIVILQSCRILADEFYSSTPGQIIKYWFDSTATSFRSLIWPDHVPKTFGNLWETVTTETGNLAFVLLVQTFVSTFYDFFSRECEFIFNIHDDVVIITTHFRITHVHCIPLNSIVDGLVCLHGG